MKHIHQLHSDLYDGESDDAYEKCQTECWDWRSLAKWMHVVPYPIQEDCIGKLIAHSSIIFNPKTHIKPQCFYLGHVATASMWNTMQTECEWLGQGQPGTAGPWISYIISGKELRGFAGQVFVDSTYVILCFTTHEIICNVHESQYNNGTYPLMSDGVSASIRVAQWRTKNTVLFCGSKCCTMNGSPPRSWRRPTTDMFAPCPVL